QQGERDPAREPPAPRVRDPARPARRSTRDAGPEPAGRRAGADPARPPGVRWTPGRGRAPARPVAPDPLSQAEPLRDLLMNWFACVGASCYAAAATWWDVRERRIPNWLSGVALLFALPAAVLNDGIGLPAAFSGLLLGGFALFVPFALGAVGAGDLK